MNKNTIMNFAFIVICFVFCELITLESACAESRIQTPEELLHIFYSFLLSNEELSHCPEIFEDPSSVVYVIQKVLKIKQDDRLGDTAKIWQYLRDHKELFLFSYIKPPETLKHIRYQYLFYAFPRSEIFFEGKMSIVLNAPLKRGQNNITSKIIEFPMERNKNPWQYRYLINVLRININGFSIFPLDNKYVDDLFYKDVGF